MPTDVYSDVHAINTTAESTCSSPAKSKAATHWCMQAAQKQTARAPLQQACIHAALHGIDRDQRVYDMFYSSIPSPPWLSLSSPYSKNAGAEFVRKNKINLAIQYTLYTQLLYSVYTRWQNARHLQCICCVRLHKQSFQCTQYAHFNDCTNRR
jgi:hypothetical protein